MRDFLLIVFMFILVQSVKAQTPSTIKEISTDTTAFDAVEIEPEFPGGLAQFYKYLSHNIRYPAEARNHKEQGKVILQISLKKMEAYQISK